MAEHATIIGAGIGGLGSIEKNHIALLEKGPRRVSPFFTPGSIINMIAGQVSMKFGLTGPNLSLVTACTTGLHCIGQAARMIAYGDADACNEGDADDGGEVKDNGRVAVCIPRTTPLPLPLSPSLLPCAPALLLPGNT